LRRMRQAAAKRGSAVAVCMINVAVSRIEQ